MGVPVELEAPVGTLNVYASTPRGWDDGEVAAIQAYARIVASVLRSAVEAHLRGVVTEQLRYALERRVLIEQAKGILMEREGLAAADAFERIRRRARSHRERVVDVARRLVEGEPLDPPAS
jgi:AmiR/NasT family two-component response regulator